jgi:hypothetical protein
MQQMFRFLNHGVLSGNCYVTMFTEFTSGFSYMYKGWIQSGGNTAVTWRMCVGWHYCRLYLIAEVQLKWCSEWWWLCLIELHCASSWSVEAQFKHPNNMFTKEDQRSWIKIEVARGRSAQTCFQGLDRKSTRLNSSHLEQSRMPSSAW